VIGKSLNPRCFKGFNKSALPVTYRANSKAWMRADIFIEWLQHLDSWFHTMDRKILLLIDNAGSHFNPKILDESNNTNEEVSDDEEEEEIIAESSHSAQSRKRRKKPKQSKRKKPIKKNPILNLLISSLFISRLIQQPIYSLWMRELSIALKQNINENFVDI
jgi:hypothetical protein